MVEIKSIVGSIGRGSTHGSIEVGKVFFFVDFAKNRILKYTKHPPPFMYNVYYRMK